MNFFFEKRLLASTCLYVRVSMCLYVWSFRMKQLGSHWTDYNQIWYLKRFRKSVEKVQLLLKFDKDWYFAGRFTYIYDKISQNYSVKTVQGYSKWLSVYKCRATIPHQIREATTIWQFHLKVVCSVSRYRVGVYPGTEGTNQNCHWNHHRWHATNSLERTRLSCWCL